MEPSERTTISFNTTKKQAAELREAYPMANVSELMRGCVKLLVMAARTGDRLVPELLEWVEGWEEGALIEKPTTSYESTGCQKPDSIPFQCGPQGCWAEQEPLDQ